jgi:hypothetical protein
MRKDKEVLGMFVPRQVIGNPFLQSHPLLQSLVGGFYPPQAMFNPMQAGLQGLGQVGGISPFAGLQGLGQIGPISPFAGLQGIGQVGPISPFAGLQGIGQVGPISPFGVPGLSPLMTGQTPFVSPFNIAANLPGLGAAALGGFSQSPWLTSPAVQHGIGGIGGPLQSQALPFLSAIAAGAGPLETQYFGGPFGQAGLGTQSTIGQSPFGGHPGLQAQGLPNPAIACEPFVGAALAQQLHPALQQQLPIRPLIAPQQLTPFQGLTPGVVPSIQATDPYSIAAQAQLLAQLSNVYQQAFRGYGGSPWTQGVGGMPGIGTSGYGG